MRKRERKREKGGIKQLKRASIKREEKKKKKK